jgi:DNA-binding IclR family transcriptional regulator
MNTAERVIAILSYLATVNRKSSLAEISKGLGLNKSSVYRILSALKHVDWISQDSETQKYTLGNRILEFCMSILADFEIRKDSRQYLEEIRNTTGETALLALRVGFERMYADQVPSYHELKHLAELGKRLPLWLGAPGKVMLAYMDKDEVETVMDNVKKSGMSVMASGQPVNVDKIQAGLADIRRKGFCLTVGERVAGITTLSAPIFDYYHRVIGCICASGPLSRFNPDVAIRYSPLVVMAARKISQQLGDYSMLSAEAGERLGR